MGSDVFRIRHRRISVPAQQAKRGDGAASADQIGLHYACCGTEDDPLILFLHGFPEFWGAWAEVLPAFADQFFAVAPDQRGYGLSSKPNGVEAYRVKHLVSDVRGLIDALSPDRPIVLVGHDWGASVAYALAMQAPERIERLVIINGAHPAAFQVALVEDERQRRASQYFHVLRSPDAETLLRGEGGSYAGLLALFGDFSDADWLGKAARDAYIDAWSVPGALTGMLNWYRASPIVVPRPGEDAGTLDIPAWPAEKLRVRMPHLVIWGEADRALTTAVLDRLPTFCDDLTVDRVPDAGHWIVHEQRDWVVGRIRAFIGQ